MKKLRHILFLKDVFIYTISAFGGPQGHLALMIKHFVLKRPYITEKDLIEYNSFCQLIPGPSSTQLLGIIAYKRGGFWLSLFSLFIWILPASIIMGLLSFFVINEKYEFEVELLLRFTQPITLSFLIYSTIRYFNTSINNTITTVILLFASTLTLSFFKTPWIIPLVIVCAGLITNISNKRIPESHIRREKTHFNWKPLVLFIVVFVGAAIMSESARKNNWTQRKQINLFENNYRFGSLVFGGGDVLLPLMIDQYVERPTSKRTKSKNPNIIKVDKSKLIAGFSIVRALPGPVFSVSSYVGGLVLSKQGKEQQLLGCFIGALSIFLPSLILLYFLIPFWERLKNQVIIIRSLEGINAAVTGVMVATAIYLLDGAVINTNANYQTINILIVCVALILLIKTKVPPPFIVLGGILLGFIFNF